MARVIRTAEEVERECGGCGSLVTYTYDDLYIDDTGHCADHLTCPVCGTRSVMPQVTWPTGWIRKYEQEDL